MKLTFMLMLRSAAGLLLPFAAVAGSVTVGTPLATGGSCFPFQCLDSLGFAGMQILYSSTAFPGPIDIEEITFFSRFGPGNFGDADFTFSFSTTSQTIGGMSPFPVDNIGTPLATFGTYHIAGAYTDGLDLLGTPYAYDPSQGNLLLEIDITNGTGQAGSGAFEITDHASSSLVAEDTFVSGGGGSARMGGPITEFSSVAAPEPVSLLLSGGVLAGILRRRRRN